MITVEEARKLYAATKAPLANHNDWYWCTEAVPALCDEIERLRAALAQYADDDNWDFTTQHWEGGGDGPDLAADSLAADGARAHEDT